MPHQVPGNEHNPCGNVTNWQAPGSPGGLERCESGRIGLTANELSWETGTQGSNPCLSARRMNALVSRMATRALFVRLSKCGTDVACATIVVISALFVLDMSTRPYSCLPSTAEQGPIYSFIRTISPTG
jgi:hypothetical protein